MKKFNVHGACIKCHGAGINVSNDLTCISCPDCKGLGRKGVRRPRKVTIPEDAASYLAECVNSVIEDYNGYSLIGPKFITDALETYNRNRKNTL